MFKGREVGTKNWDLELLVILIRRDWGKNIQGGWKILKKNKNKMKIRGWKFEYRIL